VLQITPKNRKESIVWECRVLDWLNVQGITMLAEIFMVRLEAAAPASQQKAGQSNSRFVPFVTVVNSSLRTTGNRRLNLCVRKFLPDTLSPNNDHHAQPPWATDSDLGDYGARG
jgi:hypothetical protein